MDGWFSVCLIISLSLCLSTFLYLKFLVVWALVLLADFVLEFRFEYLWPFWLFIRSVYDSFRYQGLVSMCVWDELFIQMMGLNKKRNQLLALMLSQPKIWCLFSKMSELLFSVQRKCMVIHTSYKLQNRPKKFWIIFRWTVF